MRKVIFIVIVLSMGIASYAQQPYRSITFCDANWFILPQKFSNNFSHDEVEGVLKKFESVQHRWIGYYSEDTNKIAVVSTIYEKANKKQKKQGIKTSGWVFEFYLNDTAVKKHSCYKQQMKRSIYYENGKKKEYSEFYSNGQLSINGKYDENEKQDGEWKYYDESGKLTKTVKYKSGETVN